MERTVTYSDGRSNCGLRGQDFGDHGFAIHCGKYTDGQSVGTISTAPAPDVEVGERPPNRGENFLNSDFMAFIKDNHVICLNCGRNAGSLRIYLQMLFSKASLPEGARQFELARIGSPNKIARIEAVGVRSVSLEVDISEATASSIIDDGDGDGVWDTIKRSLGQAVEVIAARDQDLEQLRSAEKGTVSVSINVPKGDIQTAKNGLDNFAEEIVEDDDAEGFVIHLRDGNTIKPNEVSIRKSVKLTTAANSVSVLQAWDEMEKYIGELKEGGQLEI